MFGWNIVEFSRLKNINFLRNIIIAFFVILFFTQTDFILANEKTTLRFAVFAYLGVEETTVKYKPLEEYLNKVLIKERVILEVLTQDSINKRIKEGTIDIVTTNPTHFLVTRSMFPLTGVIATVVQNDRGQALHSLGGVIVVNSKSKNINNLDDLIDKKIAIPGYDNLGGYRSQAYEFYKIGIDIKANAKFFETTIHQDAVLKVMNGEVDAAFVRTGIIEKMIAKNEINPNQVKIINEQNEKFYPYKLSTQLYPEWPVFALPHVDEGIIRRFASALYNLEHADSAALSAGIYGYTIASDYLIVEELSRALKLPPYDKEQEFTIKDVWRKYDHYIITIIFAIVVIILLSIRIFISRVRERNLRNRFELLLSAIGEGVFGIDKDGNCTFMNDAALGMMGFSKNDMLGKHIHNLHHHHKPNGDIYKDEDCPIQKTTKDGRTRRTEEWFFKSDGSGFYVDLIVTPLLEDNEIIGAVASFQDITSRKKDEETVLKLSKTIEQSPVSVVITDTQGLIEYVNPEFIRNSGYSYEEAIGKNPKIMKSGQTKPEVYVDLWQTLYSKVTWRGELLNKRKDGILIWEEVIISPILDKDGTITNFVSLQSNITERKRMTEELIQAKLKAEESDKLKSAFLQNISHEIRTPLNGIIGFANLLSLDYIDKEDAKEYIKFISKSGSRLIETVNNIIEISEIQTGQLPINKTSFPLNMVMYDLHDLNITFANERQNELKYELDKSDDDSMIEHDSKKIYQILSNLLNNAIKFTQNGTVKYGYEIHKEEILFWVKDSGVGIELEHKNRIFERFFQADATMSRGYEGTGLGLTISAELVGLLGGRIWVESQVGKGSEFYFTIPFKKEFKNEF